MVVPGLTFVTNTGSDGSTRYGVVGLLVLIASPFVVGLALRLYDRIRGDRPVQVRPLQDPRRAKQLRIASAVLLVASVIAVVGFLQVEVAVGLFVVGFIVEPSVWRAIRGQRSS